MSAGSRVGPYTLLRQESRDLILESWLARDERRYVLLSLLDPPIYADLEHRELVLSALEQRQGWRHARITPIVDQLEAVHPRGGATLAVAMEHVPGVTCDRLMRAIHRMPPMIAARLVERIARVTHESGMTPRALLSTLERLSSIVIDRGGAPHLLVALVPGVEQRVPSTRRASIRGRFGFMSPEAIMGEQVTHASTVFTLAVLLYRLIAGRRPFDRDSDFATLEAIRDTAYTPLSSVAQVPNELLQIVRRSLIREPRDRFVDARELAVVLDRAIPAELGENAIADLVFRYCEEDPPPELPTMEEDPLLEQIRAEPESAEAYLVYADLLQSRGDPRGELIVLCHRGLSEARAEWLDRHPELLGSIGPLLDRPDRTRLIEAFSCSHWMGDLSHGPLSAEWYLGFISSLRIAVDADLDPPLEELLQLLAREESARFLRSLTIGPRDGETMDLDPVYRLLSTLRFELTSLYLGDLARERPATEHPSVNALCAPFPKLERLTLRGASIRLEPLSFPELRELSIHTPHEPRELRGAIYQSTLPKLEKLDLRSA